MDERRQQSLARATDSLRSWLAPLEFPPLPRAEVTALVTAQIAEWAQSYRFEVTQQVKAIATRRRRYGRTQNGWLDLECRHRSGMTVAIEIDFANKFWSIEKLAAEADAGKLAIWVKWGGPVALSLIPEKIGVVELRADWSKQDGEGRYHREAHASFPAPVLGHPNGVGSVPA
jgi:hypothetical protein